MTALLKLGPWRVTVSVLKSYIGPDGQEVNNSFHLLFSPQSLEYTDSYGCVRSLSVSSFVSLTTDSGIQ